MKKLFYIIALCGLVSAALLSGCKQEETSSTSTMSSTNASATNAPAH